MRLYANTHISLKFSNAVCDVEFLPAATRYSAIVIPHSMGAIQDLAKDRSLGDILNHFVANNSE